MSFSKSHTRRLRRLGSASRRLLQRLAVGSVLGTSLLGCATDQELKYLGSDKELSYYKTAATSIDYPAVDTETAPQAAIAQRPRTVFEREKDEIWNVSLSEAIQLAIQNNRIIRSRANSSAPSAILSGGDNSRSVYEPAIQETGVLFGGRGVAGALAAFDATFKTGMKWGRDETPLNTNKNFGKPDPVPPLLPLPKVVTDQSRETGAFTSELSKNFGYGGLLTLDHSVNYVGTNLSGPKVFPSDT